MNDALVPIRAPGAGASPLACHHYPALMPTDAEPLVLLHGWGFDSRCWEPLLPALRRYTDVMALDLPGFGDSAGDQDFELDAVLARILESLPPRATLMGWSLGGMLAVALAARHPERITRVVTLASNLRFVADHHWPEAMPESVNRRFASQFQNDPQRGLARFVGLVAHGDHRERSVRSELSRLSPTPGPQWSRALATLAELDNTGAFRRLRQPGLHLFAEADALVPVAAASSLPALNQRQRVSVIAGAGHAPHWSRPDRVAETVLAFLRQSAGQLDKRRVADSFSRAAPGYDSVARLQRAVGETLLNRLGASGVEPRGRLLDLGCGTGHGLERLVQRWPEIEPVGLDIAPGMLEFARRERSVPAHWLCADAEQLPLAGASVDTVFSSLSVQWCEQLTQLFVELFRVLRPGGQLHFSTLGPRTLWELKSAWQRVDGYVHVNRFPTRSAVDAALAGAGFARRDWHVEERVLEYPGLADLTRELKALGAHNANRGQPEGLTGRRKMAALQRAYEPLRRNGKLPASYQVFYLSAHKPGD